MLSTLIKNSLDPSSIVITTVQHYSLIFPQGGQGKRVWLTVREPSMKAGWRDAPLALWDSVVSNIHGIFNIKRKYFSRCLTLAHVKTWNIQTVFMKYSLSQTKYYFMLWSLWMQRHRNYSCTFFQKSQLVKLEMFFD